VERNRSFNIPDKKYYTGGVKGNGKTLGLTNGSSDNYGLQTPNGGTVITLAGTNKAGTNAGSACAYSYAPAEKTLGISRDVTKSGIIVEPDTQISMIIKY